MYTKWKWIFWSVKDFWSKTDDFDTTSQYTSDENRKYTISLPPRSMLLKGYLLLCKISIPG